MMKQGKPVYVRDEESAWAPALQVHSNGNKAIVVRPIYKTEQQMLQCGDKQKYSKKETMDLSGYPNNVLPMQNVDASGNLEDYKDMVQLPYMHEVCHLLNALSRSWFRSLTPFCFCPPGSHLVQSEETAYERETLH